MDLDSDFIRTLTLGVFETHCYIVKYDGITYVIDPACNSEEIIKNCDGKLDYILLTHAHFDHCGALADLKKKFPECKFCVSEKEDLSWVNKSAEFFGFSGMEIPKPDVFLTGNASVGPFDVLETPGHTVGSVCFVMKDKKIIFTGDTVIGEYPGRTDIGGNESLMLNSLKILFSEKFIDYVFMCGH